MGTHRISEDSARRRDLRTLVGSAIIWCMEKSTLSRAEGCLVGPAVGDALGAAVEFQPPGSFPPVTGMRGGVPHGLEAGEWADDISMALALADSILAVGWDLDDQARRCLDRFRNGAYSVTGQCFDIGDTTATAHRFPGDIAGLVERCIESSLPTHRAPQATSVCGVLRGCSLRASAESTGTP